MKIIAIFGFFFMNFLNLQLTSGYIAGPLYNGRTFDFFNLFPFGTNSLSSLSTRISTLESTTAPISNQFQSLINRIMTIESNVLPFANLFPTWNNLLQSLPTTLANVQTQLADSIRRLASLETTATNTANQISALNQQVATLQTPTCSTIAPSTARVALGKCYQVFTNTLSFAAARDLCKAGGGKLAEPAAEDAAALWTELKKPTLFQTEAARIDTAGVWLGFTQGLGADVGASFTALSNPGATLLANKFVADSIAAGAGVNNAAVLNTPSPVVGTPFVSADSVDGAAITKAFICQY